VEDERLEDAELVLPVTTMAEENGTYVNRDGRVQRFQQVRGGPGIARPAWWVAAEAWAKVAPGRDVPATAAEAFAALAEDIPALAGLRYETLGLTGRSLTNALAGSAR
jgi:predicted molibdopterin-dependent oxidoreductase YjgC